MKEEWGLDHFEGRSWPGLHHHAVLVMMALAFLQHLRLTSAPEWGKKEARRAAPSADTPCRAARHPRADPHHGADPMPVLPVQARSAQARVELPM